MRYNDVMELIFETPYSSGGWLYSTPSIFTLRETSTSGSRKTTMTRSPMPCRETWTRCS